VITSLVLAGLGRHLHDRRDHTRVRILPTFGGPSLSASF
jgi:hypothetical protein